MGDSVRRGGLVSRLARRGEARRTGRCGRGPSLSILALLFLSLAAALPASAVTVTLTANSPVLLGGNVTISGSAEQCMTSVTGASTCVGFIVAVDGKVINKSLTRGASFSVNIPTGSTAISPDCANAANKGVVCITLPGAYRVQAWVINDTISDAVSANIDNTTGTTNVVGSTINDKPPDATATFLVSSPKFSANLSKSSIISGETAEVTGVAEGMTSPVPAWVFDRTGNLAGGRCYYRDLTPDSGGAFKWTLDRAITGVPGEYTVFVMFPGADGVFAKTSTPTPPFVGAAGACPATLTGDGFQILSTLKGQADTLRTDDTFQTFTLKVSPPFLRLDPIAIAFLDDTLNVTGRSNRPSGKVFVTVSRPFFEETGSADLVDGAFSISISTRNSSSSTAYWLPGNYTIRAVDDAGNEDQMTVEFVQKRPADFKVDNLVVYSEDGTSMDGRAPQAGQKLTASAILVNRGESAGNATLHFQLSGRDLCAPSAALGPGQFVQLNCTFTVNYSGIYTLQADGKSVTLRVGGPPIPEIVGEVKSISSLPSGGQARLLFSGAVDQVVLQARAPVSGAQVVVLPLDQRPAGAPAPVGTPFRFFRLSGVNLPDASVGTLSVVFRVDGAWLAEKKLDPSTVRIYRLVSGSTGAAGSAAASQGLAWRVEPSITRLGTEGRTDGSSDIVYQAQVSAFGDFAVVGGSTEGAIAAVGGGSPLDILFNIPVMAAIAGGAGFAVFAWRKGWLDRFLRRKKAAEPGAPGAPALAEGAAEALPRTYEDEVYSLFRSGQLAQAFRRIFDEVATPLKASLGLEGTFTSGELLREAEGKGLDPTLLATLGQLFATCDAARFSGIPPTEEHLKWSLRAARSVLARLSGGGALPASTGGGEASAMPPTEAGFPDAAAGGASPPGFEPQPPPSGPEGGFEAAGLPPDADLPPAPGHPEERRNGNGNGNNNRRRRRRRGGGNGNGSGNGNRRYTNGNGNSGGHPGSGNGNYYQASGRLLPYASPTPRGTYYGPARGGFYSAAPPPSFGAWGTERVRAQRPAGPALTAYSTFQRGLVPGPASVDPPPPMPVPPLSPRPNLPGPNGHGTNGTNGHGTSGTNGHGLNGNGHRTNGHGTSGTNGHGTGGSAPRDAAPQSPAETPSRPAAPRAARATPPIAFDRATMAAMMAAEYRNRRRGPGRPAPGGPAPPEGGRITGNGGRTPTPSGPTGQTTGPPDGSGTARSAGPSNPPPSLSSASPPEGPAAGEKSARPSPLPR